MYKDEGTNARQVSYPINVLDSSNKDKVHMLIHESDVILDTAASPTVSKSLSNDYEHNKRIISFFMNPSGSSAIALIEDVERIYRLDTIEYEYFKRLIEVPEHEKHFIRTGAIYYSTSCRNRSTIISQDSVATFSALCSKKFKNALIHEHAEVLIWTENDDGIILDKFVPAKYNKHEIFSSDGDKWDVFISNEVERDIEKARKAAISVETGGVLVGGIDKHRNIIYIVMNIPAPDDSVHAPTSYIRGYRGLAAKMKNIGLLTHNALGYIGEWHSHPTPITAKSKEDIVLHNTLKEFASGNFSPAVLIIAGTCGYSLYI